MATAQRQAIKTQKAVQATADGLAALSARIEAMEGVTKAVEELRGEMQSIHAKLDTLLGQSQPPSGEKGAGNAKSAK